MTRRPKPADMRARAAYHSPQEFPPGSPVDHATLFPGLRPRHDGWTEERTQRFLDVLGHSGCVEDAARVAGMSAVGARRMRARFPLFRAVWDAALARAGQGLVALAYKRAVEGRETVIIRKGEEYERRIEPSDAMLGLLIKRGDLVGGGAGMARADDVLSFEEWERDIRFDGWGKKYQAQSTQEQGREFCDKMMVMRKRLFAYAEAGGTCPTCRQPMPKGEDGRSMAELVAVGLVGFDRLFDQIAPEPEGDGEDPESAR
jgi:hypothetical protein